ncbi:MAG: MaoC family dehydratase [Roseiarcus sp.]|jgi:acyl dehydratase
MNALTPPRPIPIDRYIAMAGGEIGVSRWFLIDQKRIDAFAEITEDRQFLHVDPEAARATPFGGTIAHGFLTLSMLSALAIDALPRIEGRTMGINYGFEKLRFLAPVPAGARIRGRFSLASVALRAAAEFLSRIHVTVEIEGAAKPALVAEWLTLFVLDPESVKGDAR